MNNSSEDLSVNGLPEGQEEAAGLSDSDKNNANISQSKGAIPKVKPVQKRKSKNNNEIVQNGIKVSDAPPSLVKDTEDTSSSDENELLSISDDGCIYTYKADDSADLPNSLFHLNVNPEPEVEPPQRDNVSPEMDFLEMDFDPELDSSDSVSAAESETVENLPQDVTPNPEVDTNNTENKPENVIIANVPPVESSLANKPDPIEPPRMPWSCLFRQRTSNTSTNYARLTKCHHGYEGELFNQPSNEFCDKKLEQVMIWTEEEACQKQVTQIAASSCGATATLNVLKALRLPIPSNERLKSVFHTRYRANSSPLTQYLISRSIAGSTHEGIINWLSKLSEGRIYSRFFHMYPERVINLSWWLQYWMGQGAVPVATLNLQKCVGEIPDAWHHQMVFGIGPCGVYLTNPLECIKPELLWPQLSSESILLIRREDVLSRWNTYPSLEQLMGIRDTRWTSLNVVGQVANLVCESHREYRPGFITTSHIKIPASYSAGITLSLLKDSPACRFLKECPELPLLPSLEEVSSTDIF